MKYNETHATKSTRNKLDKKFVYDENLIFQSSEGVKIDSGEQVSYSKMVSEKILFSHLSSPDQIIVLPEEVEKNFINRSKSIHFEDSLGHFKLLVDCITTSEKTGKKPVEKNVTCAIGYGCMSILRRRGVSELNNVTSAMRYFPYKQILTKKGVTEQNRNNEDMCNTQGSEKESEDEEEDEVAENHPENEEHLVTSQNLDMLTTQDQIQDERHKSTEASEGSANQPIHLTDICSDDHRTTHYPQEDNRIEMLGSMINENWWKVQAKQIPSSEANTDASSDESLSTVESTAIRLYRDVIRNETSRMMSSIDRVMSEAMHLFGFERSQIFFDLLLDEELCQFESGGAISEFVPNMVASIVRQNVISFFEHAHDMMNILMTLLLRCPDRNILQQMPVQDFTSLIKSVIKSSLKTKTKGREKLSLERKIYTMVGSKDFERSLGEEIPEDVLNRLRNGDEMVVHRFVDTRLERHQPSDRRDNRPIHSVYFPSDCRLFIYIPTDNGNSR